MLCKKKQGGPPQRGPVFLSFLWKVLKHDILLKIQNQ